VTNGPVAVRTEDVSFRYGDRPALDGVSFDVAEGTVFGLLGPNGGGKSTLFRLLATILPVQAGRLAVFGADLATQASRVRHTIGTTFQSPSLDGKLTVAENLRAQGRLYGLCGPVLRERIDEVVAALSLEDRLGARVDTLSGGGKRRTEIAKGLLHRPRLLLLDEPSTGLDPGARLDLWSFLAALRRDRGTTVLVTTHLMDEAERCDRLAILDRGRIVADGPPAALRGSIGGDCLTLAARDPQSLAASLRARFGVEGRPIGEGLRIEHPRGHELLREIVEAFPEEVVSATLGKPTLEDVFVARTGHRFRDAGEVEPESGRSGRGRRR
jgi:ABC-2 type transport system ATP-binding protein